MPPPAIWRALPQALGQFNLGFIIARLGRDLFIVDQHASGGRRAGCWVHRACGARGRRGAGSLGGGGGAAAGAAGLESQQASSRSPAVPADEKHNFERLQRTTRLNRQPLLAPQRLELSPTEELTVR